MVAVLQVMVKIDVSGVPAICRHGVELEKDDVIKVRTVNDRRDIFDDVVVTTSVLLP